jgi:hypothetical protein
MVKLRAPYGYDRTHYAAAAAGGVIECSTVNPADLRSGAMNLVSQARPTRRSSSSRNSTFSSNHSRNRLDPLAVIPPACSVGLLTSVPELLSSSQRFKIHGDGVVTRGVDEIGFPLCSVDEGLPKKTMSAD